MSIKCFQAKVISDTSENRQYLWLTHRLFNEAVLILTQHLFRMRRGDCGPDFKAIYGAIRNSQNSFAKLEPITSKKEWRSAKAGTGDEKNAWADLCAKINREGRILFDRDKPPFAFGSEFWRKVCEMAVQLIHSHDGLLKDWRDQRKVWQETKAKWETENETYMKQCKPVFDAFQEEAGRLAGSRKRWLLYLDFLVKHPELASWRGGQPQVTPLTPAERKQCRRPADHFDMFWEKNPELAELDRLDRKWRREFARFKRRPTWTNPSPETHPAWFSFKRGATYKNLDFQAGTLDVNALCGEDLKGRRGTWTTCRFAADNRLLRLQPIDTPVEVGRAKFSWLYADPLLGKERPAEVKGIKLVFKHKLPYLYFSVDMADEPMPHLVRPGFDDRQTGKKATPADIPDGTRFLSIDFGQRSVAACSVCPFIGGQPQAPDSVFLLKMPRLSFSDIGGHEKVIRRKTRGLYRPAGKAGQTRHAPRGGATFRALRRHVMKMKEDRYKKAAHLILQAARRHKAAVILVENLENYRPDLERPSRENRARMLWSVQRIIEFLEQSAKPLGIRLWRVSPYWSSRFCSACGHPGARFSVPRKAAWGRYYERRHGPIRKVLVEPGGQFFVCSNPKCPRSSGIINADVNAALNLHRILAGTFERPQGDKNNRTWRGQPLDWKAVRLECQKRLDNHFGKKADLAKQTPF